MLDFVNGGVEVVPGSSDYPAVESTEPFVPDRAAYHRRTFVKGGVHLKDEIPPIN